ncbi:MAG: hypothetical protein ABII18_00145, partial [bacterium]
EKDIISKSTIIICMPNFSASAPLITFTKKYKQLRVASMPMVEKRMEETGLAADYRLVAKKCEIMEPLFKEAVGIEVLFSTGHQCYFDISNNNHVYLDDADLSRDVQKIRLCNLPAGEVATCPNESPDSKTAGEIPAIIDNEQIVHVIKNNNIINILGDGPTAQKRRIAFASETALRNIAEVAIGCNEKAAVAGNILEDEKAGFHWAYGRSDHLGGTTSPDNFSAPDKVEHTDIVYAIGNPIVCSKLDFIFADGSRKTGIKEGKLILI